MKLSLRLTLLLLGLGEYRLALAAVRHGLSYRRRNKLSSYRECLLQARGHAQSGAGFIREWIQICLAIRH